ncbi:MULTISPECIES: host attachment protein [Geobacter]|uniref:Host attachment protein n=2 Tax=Geobacter TaxID=28231 RepID=A0A0C1TQL8_9BACT|nr:MULTISPECIES: host attachment protein [Geobacter]ANA40953.1 hypothetical protein A2G06_12500 [Geobacter anodireducens]KIE43059.1 hypothetical protein SE37_10645 [Geobacter soli]MBE2886906.1 host attachment protein [Geobacter anodireducens]HMN02613.1 host attachment protein [Geobacter anodireducens]
MSDIIITVDLGIMNAYEIVRDPLKIESDRLEPIKSPVAVESSAKVTDKYGDAAGRFYQGGGTGTRAAGFGEQHTVELETKRRLIRLLAENINRLVSEKDCDRWFLAADRSINNQILESLAPAVKAKLKRNIAANLTKIDKSEVMSHFA